MSDPIGFALDQLRGIGLVVDRIELQKPSRGRVHRVRHQDDKGKTKSGWYIAHEFRTLEGKVLVFGTYGRFVGAENYKRKFAQDPSAHALTAEDRRAWAQQQAKAQADHEKALFAGYEEMATKAQKTLSGLPSEGKSKYLDTKKVRAFGLRFAKGGAVMPLADHAGKVWSLQWLYDNGDKILSTGGMVSGCGHWLRKPDPEHGVIVIGEGYATVAAVVQSVAVAGICTLNCHNLEAVARWVRQQYPQNQIVILADDDRETATRPQMHGKNPGMVAATNVARAVRAHLAVPHGGDPLKNFDWNDLLVETDALTVRDQLLAALDTPVVGKLAVTVEDDHNSSEPPEFERVPLSVLEQEHQQPRLETEDEFSEANLVRRYVMIYGTKTAFDRQRHDDIALDALSSALTRGRFKTWMESQYRRMCYPEQVVFDPRRDPDDLSICNRYAGWPTPAKKGSKKDQALVKKWLDVGMWIFSGIDGPDEHLGLEVYEWAMNWIAYQIQHPGAKMRTSIVVRGAQGTGKNTFFDPLVKLFGDYGNTIGSQDIEDKYTAWASRKMFVLCDEAMNAEEQSKLKGRLKALITGFYVQIERKFFDRHVEQNHINFVFLSNEIRAVPVEIDDRRYMVAQTPNRNPEAHFYTGLNLSELGEGFYGELMQTLLDWPVPKDFNEFTYPIPTAAKDIMLRAGLTGHNLFYFLWREGRLALPLMACTVRQCYRFYEIWSQRTKQTYVKPPNFFGAFMQGQTLMRHRSAEVQLIEHGVPTVKQIACYTPNYQSKPHDVPQKVWLGNQIDEFAKKLAAYEGASDET